MYSSKKVLIMLTTAIKLPRITNINIPTSFKMSKFICKRLKVWWVMTDDAYSLLNIQSFTSRPQILMFVLNLPMAITKVETPYFNVFISGGSYYQGIIG